MRYPIISPIGRIVEGDPWVASEKNADGTPRIVKTGRNTGKPSPQFYIGLAVPKLIQGHPNPDFGAFYTEVDRIARMSWPNLFPNGGACIRGDFAWKIRDGDGMNREGKSLAEKVGFAGHWIIGFATSFAPEIVVETSPGVYAQLTDPAMLKRGYWARVGASISSNESTQTPGLYINLEKIEWKGKGEVIQSGLSAAQTFAPAAAAIPEGMQALTAADLVGAPAGFGHAGAGPAPAPAFAAPQPGFPQPGLPVHPGGPAPASGAMVPQPGPAPAFAMGAPTPMTFHTNPAGLGNPAAGLSPAGAPGAVAGFPGVGQPAAPALAAPVPIAPAYSGFMGAAPVMLAAAGGATYEQFVANGWTDDAMVAAGYMAART
jgi:hypothetical protein